MSQTDFHKPVLVQEVLHYLITDRNGIYVDCTVGGGGHSEFLLEKISPEGLLIGIDADAEALSFAETKLEKFPNKVLRQIFYDQLDVVLIETGYYPVTGVFYDLGISSFQVDMERRGFSFQVDAPLDMRFDQSQKLTAADVLNTYSQQELERIIRRYGEERHWRAIAREIVRKRQAMAFRTTRDLVDVVRMVVGEHFLVKSLARVFQAIRIEVNRELERLQRSLEIAFRYLRQGGRLVVISYHSLEDRIVKEFLKEKASDCICPPGLPECVCGKVKEMKILTRKVVTPSKEEIAVNPRSRSARLRAAEKIVPFSED